MVERHIVQQILDR